MPIPALPIGDYTPEPLQRPSHIDRYVIDASQSFIKAYVPIWERTEGPLDDSLLGMGLDAGTYWLLSWHLQTYSLSGSFDVETVYSDWDWERSRLYVRRAEITTDSPAYAGFILPTLLAKMGQSLTFSSNPCFDHNFADPPGWTGSCTGWQAGPTRGDIGMQHGQTISVGGSVTPLVGPSISYAEYTSLLPPEWLVDYREVTGVFEYQLVAVTAVPEPQAYAMFLAGMGVVGFGASRRRKALATNSV